MKNNKRLNRNSGYILLNFFTVVGLFLPIVAQAQITDTQVQEATCEIAQAYSWHNLKVNFDNNDLPMLCEPKWQQKEGQNIPEFYHHDYDDDSDWQKRAQERGARLLKADERVELLARAEDMKKQMAYACCGNDFSCKTAWNDISFSFCQGDFEYCYKTGGRYHTVNSEERIMYAIRSVYNEGKLIRGKSKAFTENFVKKFNKITNQNLSDYIRANKAIFDQTIMRPVAGDIRLNPYLLENIEGKEDLYIGGFKTTPKTLAHELGHACNSIRKQSALYRGSQVPREDVALAFISRFSNNCDNSDEVLATYKRVVGLYQHSPNMYQCINDLVQSMDDPSKSTYRSNACKNSQIEEAYAETLAYRFVPAKHSYAWQCSGKPSRAHPKLGELSKCIMTFDRAYRNNMQNFLCAAK